MTDFASLYKSHSRDVFRFALYLSGNRSDAEDITSETFARAWAAPEPLRMATVKGYLLTIARNLFLKGLRRKARDAEFRDEHQDPAAGPAARAEWSAELDAVLAGLQKLPEVDRTALLMRGVEQMPYEEIARALGISLAAVKVKLHRARLALAHIRGDA